MALPPPTRPDDHLAETEEITSRNRDKGMLFRLVCICLRRAVIQPGRRVQCHTPYRIRKF